MRSVPVLAVVLAAACAGAGAPSTSPAGPGGPAPISADDRQFSGRQVMVTLPPGPPPIVGWVVRSLEEKYRLRTVFAWSLASLGGERCMVFEVPRGQTVEELVAALEEHPQVGTAQAIHEFETAATGYNDPYAHLQYGAQALNLEQAHRIATGKGVRIAVVDTGVDVDHPDLRGRIARVGNFVDRGERSFTSDAHGTAVAGVIAARANNEVGIVGVAPGAEVLALKACWEQPPGSRRGVCNSYTLAKAVDFAIVEKAQVLNFSLAGPVDPLLTRLIARAVERGVTVVAAQGEGQGREFPASLDGVLGIAATDPEGALRGGAPARSRPLLAAPGIDILTTAPRNAYDFFSGSSFAAAHVSGVVALLLEKQPKLTPREIERLFEGTARKVNGGGATAGLIDACAALAKATGSGGCS
ncbi:MAG TPA: S8 family serine peptidase [Thermoanaerobaculia bacterium]